MFTFDEYAAGSGRQLLTLLECNPFALVVSASSATPTASHVPVVPAADDPRWSRLRTGEVPGPDAPTEWSGASTEGPGAPTEGWSGLRLWGHMARVNPQWEQFAAGRPVLVVFSGPHAYVSAGVYGRTPAVPTWNYSAVHVTGIAEVITDPEETLAVLRETVRVSEDADGTGWDMTDSVPHFRRIMSGVTAFSITISAVQAVFKLSQDKPDLLWGRVHDALAGRPGMAAGVAADMAEVRHQHAADHPEPAPSSP